MSNVFLSDPRWHECSSLCAGYGGVGISNSVRLEWGGVQYTHLLEGFDPQVIVIVAIISKSSDASTPIGQPRIPFL